MNNLLSLLSLLGSPIGSGLSLVIGLWNGLKNFPWILRLIRNWKDLKTVIESVRDFSESARQNKGFPKASETKKLLESVRILFEKEIVDFPDLDEKAFAETLREIEGNLITALDQGRRTAGDFTRGGTNS